MMLFSSFHNILLAVWVTLIFSSIVPIYRLHWTSSGLPVSLLPGHFPAHPLGFPAKSRWSRWAFSQGLEHLEESTGLILHLVIAKRAD